MSCALRINIEFQVGKSDKQQSLITTKNNEKHLKLINLFVILKNKAGSKDNKEFPNKYSRNLNQKLLSTFFYKTSKSQIP